jgi:Fe2+ transport system protein FeoA
VGLFRRQKPLHERLADAAGMTTDFDAAEHPGLSADAPGWDGEQRGEPGIHGVPRARRWDTVASAQAPELTGDVVHFVALEDGTLVVEEDEPDGALSALAEAVEETTPPPYRAEAVRKGPETWAVAASRIAVASVPGLTGDEVELTSTREGRVLRVDGRTTMGSVRELERLGATEGTEYVVLAKRLDGDLWEVEATAL